MSSRLFSNSVIKRNFFVIVCVIVLINTLSLLLWYDIKIRPVFLYNDEVASEIREVIDDSYKSEKDLVKQLESLEDKYNARFKLVDSSKEEIINTGLNNVDYFLYSDVIYIDSDVYLLDVYIHREFSMTGMSISLISFQILVVLVLMIITFLVTGKTVVKPIQKIISDIRDYKFGKKPTRNEVNNELDVIQNEFVNLVDTLEDEKKEQNRIIASISHDIKTPLTSILGYSSLMEDGDLTIKEAKEYSLKISEKAIHIKNILGTFDDYLTNYDNKKLKLSKVLIKDIVKELDNDYRIELESKNIEFVVECDCSNEVIDIDALKIKRIFSNIISNSIRYISDDGCINISINKVEDNIIFKVKDNGCGIDEGIINKVFDPFFTTDKSRKISGLGLSICKEFIEMHGGEIKLHNDNGLVIEFNIPIKNKKD